jgi:hypothetical protein
MSFTAIERALPGGSARTAAGQLAGGLLVAVPVAALTLYVVTISPRKGIAVMLVVLGSVWCATTRRTNLALALVMVYLGALDGYLKLSTGSSLVTFVRDLLLYAIVAGLLIRAIIHRQRLAAPPMSAWVILFAVVVLVQIANPDDGSLYHSVAGVRQHLEFVPLFFLTYAFVRTKKALRAFVILLALLAAANSVANVIQFRETPAQFAAWGPGYAQRILGLGQFDLSGRTFFATNGTQYARPFGLMSEAGSGGLVAAFALGAVLALASLPGRRRYVGLAIAVGAVSVAGIATSQGRAVIVVGVIVVLTYALLTTTSRRGAATVLALAAIAGASFFAVTGIIHSSQTPTLRYQDLTATDLVQVTSSARGKSLDQIPSDLVKHPLGYGLGVGGPAAGTAGAPPQANNVDTENEVSFLLLETGIPGMVLLLGFAISICALGLRRCRREPDPETRVLLAAILAPIAGLLALYVVSAASPTTPGGPYLWAAGGIAAYWLITRPRELARAAAPAAAG